MLTVRCGDKLNVTPPQACITNSNIGSDQVNIGETQGSDFCMIIDGVDDDFTIRKTNNGTESIQFRAAINGDVLAGERNLGSRDDSAVNHIDGSGHNA